MLVSGCEFSVGDDCVAIKSGKLSMERPVRPPCTAVRVTHCSMHDGHGAVVIGSEGQGVSRRVLTQCEETLRIPMRPRCESLNAAAAGAVVLWEMGRQSEGGLAGG